MSGNSFPRSRRSPGPAASKSVVRLETTDSGENVTPKSVERENAICAPSNDGTFPEPSGQLMVLAPFSHTTYTSPFGPQIGRVPVLDEVGVVVLSSTTAAPHAAP